MQKRPQRTLITLTLALAALVVVGGGPASLADGLGSVRAKGAGQLSASRMNQSCRYFFRGGNKLLKGGAVTTADDLSLLTSSMRDLDHYQRQATARILAYEKQCWRLIRSGQLQNQELLAALGRDGQAAIDARKTYSDAYDKMTENAKTLRQDLGTRRLRALDEIIRSRSCGRDLSWATDFLQRDYDGFQGLSATRLSHCGDPRSPKGTVVEVYSGPVEKK